MNARTAQFAFILFLAGMTLSTQRVFAGFLDQLLESAVGGSSNSNSGNGSSYNKALQDRSQTLREDEERLDAAYSQLRQKQAAGEDTSADMANIQNLEATYRGRKQQVRELQWQAEREQEYARRRQYQNQNQNYSNSGYNQNGYRQNSYNNTGFNNDPYGNQNSFQNDDNDGFRVRFGGN